VLGYLISQHQAATPRAIASARDAVLRELARYELSPGRISITKDPPLTVLISPAWTAAMQIEESSG
jgi:hypothetical protein